jgi:hypothetical protein
MNTTPYVRLALTATRRGVADAAAVAEGWVDRLDVLLSGAGEQAPAQGAYDLLALWAALRRLRPDLLTQMDGLGASARADREIQDQGRAAATLALEVLNPEGWLEEARELLADNEVEPDPAELTARAVALLADLDEADLVVWAARALGVPPAADLEQALRACAAWLEQHADVFLHAAVYVQAVALGLRADLPAVDLNLAWTADKYVLLLDRLEEAEAELSATGEPLEPALFEAARRRFLTAAQAPDARRWLPPLRPWQAAAAAGPGGQPHPRALRWRSPDGRREATLVLPSVSDPVRETGQVRLNFFAGEEPARSPVPETVHLAGVPAAVETEGTATFVLGRLRQALEGGEDWTLRGPDGALWEFLGTT